VEDGGGWLQIAVDDISHTSYFAANMRTINSIAPHGSLLAAEPGLMCAAKHPSEKVCDRADSAGRLMCRDVDC
jgi:hypothetical protein